jgi:hypothetical protein
MSRSQWRLIVAAFVLGAFVPLMWGILGFVYFSVPEGAFSRAFWRAVYLTCPSWRINGYKSYLLTPLLNGLMYVAIAVALISGFSLVRRLRSRTSGDKRITIGSSDRGRDFGEPRRG